MCPIGYDDFMDYDDGINNASNKSVDEDSNFEEDEYDYPYAEYEDRRTIDDYESSYEDMNTYDGH